MRNAGRIFARCLIRSFISLYFKAISDFRSDIKKLDIIENRIKLGWSIRGKPFTNFYAVDKILYL